MEKFRKKKLRRLPVLENGKLIGFLTNKDVLKIDPGLFQMIAETIMIKEETAKLKRRDNPQRNEGICEECGDYNILYREDGQLICDNCYSKR